MPFDPARPATGSPITSAELRAQFNALRDLIVAPVAATATSNTTTPGTPVAVSVFMESNGTLRFVFDIPQGIPGEVTTAQLYNELSNTANYATNQALGASSNISNAVPTLDTPMTGDLEELRLKLNELILALRR